MWFLLNIYPKLRVFKYLNFEGRSRETSKTTYRAIYRDITGGHYL
jgi:hypothetical protein